MVWVFDVVFSFLSRTFAFQNSYGPVLSFDDFLFPDYKPEPDQVRWVLEFSAPLFLLSFQF